MVDFHGLTYEEFCDCVTDRETGNIFPNGIPDSLALKILFDHFLEPEYYISYSCGREQANTEMVAEILSRYPGGKIKKIPKFSKRVNEGNFLKFLKENGMS